MDTLVHVPAETPQEPKVILWLLSKSDVLAIPAIGYFLAFRYHEAYLGSFGVPVEFVRIDLTNLLIFSAGVFGFAVAFYGPIDQFLSLGGPPPVKRGSHRFGYYSALIFLIGILHWPLGLPWLSVYVIWPAVALVFSIISEFLGWFLNRRLPSGAEKIRKPWDSYGRWKAKLGNYFTYMVVLILGSFLSSALGSSAARRQAYFVGLTALPNSVLVAIVDGKAVSAIYDPLSKRVGGEFLVCELGKDAQKFQPRPFGPLRFDP